MGGPDGVLTTLVKELLEAALEGEVEAHLEADKYTDPDQPNRRNGYTAKTVNSEFGPFPVETPRDRNGTFEPQIIGKRETQLGTKLEEQILALYARGVSYNDISSQLEELYGIEVSPAFITSVTDKVVPRLREWQERPLQAIYPLVWMDAVHFKVRHEGRVQTRALYVVLGFNSFGQKDVLGLYIAETEGAHFWLSVLTDLQNRGVRDIFIASIDNLKGFADAIEAMFPQTDVQLCIIHQIRNTRRYLHHKDIKPFMADLRLVYQAPGLDVAEHRLNELEQKWGAKYPVIIRSWRNNWPRLTQFFRYPAAIRKVTYTTNPVEALNKQIRRVTKTKGAFVNEMALLKQVFVAIERVSVTWRRAIHGWPALISQLAILFPGRLDPVTDIFHSVDVSEFQPKTSNLIKVKK